MNESQYDILNIYGRSTDVLNTYYTQIQDDVHGALILQRAVQAQRASSKQSFLDREFTLHFTPQNTLQIVRAKKNQDCEVILDGTQNWLLLKFFNLLFKNAVLG